MKKLLLLLVPVLLSAQVEVDTVIRLPSFVMNGHFVPELNKLYLVGCYEHEILDCSTYQVLARIPRSYDNSWGYTSWNWRRQKLYVGFNPYPDSLVVIDMAAGTLVTTIAGSGRGSAYVATTDRLYRGTDSSLVALDCAADTVVRSIPLPIPGYEFYCPAWDSVGNKLYVPLGGWGLPPKLAVYDCATDSLLTVIAIPAPNYTLAMNFDYIHRKAYYSIGFLGGPGGVVDTKRDTVVKVFPFDANASFNIEIALNTRDHKAYILGTADTLTGGSALYVVDCDSDSIIKKLEFPRKPWPVGLVRWVPWSNRIYASWAAPENQDLGMYVIDCNTDSIIVDNLVLGYYPPIDFQIDPIRERVFAIGFESTSVHVLRDTGYAGVAESPTAGVMPKGNARAHVVTFRDGIEVEYQLPAIACVRAALHDAVGRQVGVLDAGRQQPGTHRMSWNQDRGGGKLASGAYFVLLDMGTEKATLKAVIR